ncbi:MAG: hypothetical protein OXI27_05300 [Thaumarchaeota archaeon]|nr:hypothetical protein [Nitrososphaerota archaeon]
MSVVGKVSDTSNALLSRREITCDFAGLGGKLSRLDAVEMVSKEYGLDGKTVIPMRLKNHVGRPAITGLFYVYDDESLARKHVNPTIFARLEKSRAKKAEEEGAAAEDASSEEGGEEAKDSPGAAQDGGNAGPEASADESSGGKEAEAAS